jgi:hypothetical protein
MQSDHTDPIEVPEDVRAELDTEERRTSPTTSPVLPEDVLSEQDRQARVADEIQRGQLTEGGQPALLDEREPNAL